VNLAICTAVMGMTMEAVRIVTSAVEALSPEEAMSR